MTGISSSEFVCTHICKTKHKICTYLTSMQVCEYIHAYIHIYIRVCMHMYIPTYHLQAVFPYSFLL